MRTPKFLQNRFLRAAAATCSALLLAAPHHHPDIDPSLLAAEPYNPELWNGEISNEFLIDVYNEHKQAIDKLSEFRRLSPPHPAHRGLDIPLMLADEVTKMRDEYKGTDIEFIYAISYQLSIPQYEMISLLSDLNKISSQQRFQDDANCYSYSVNDHRNIFYGIATGTRGWDAAANDNALIFKYREANHYQQFIHATIDGAIHDGLIYTGTQQQSRAGYYRVALLISKANPAKNLSNDYHWARQHTDGTWSHKMADLNVTNIDFGGNIITDPTRANWGEYKFFGYFLVPRGGINVGPYYDSRVANTTISAQHPTHAQPTPQTVSTIIVTASHRPSF